MVAMLISLSLSKFNLAVSLVEIELGDDAALLFWIESMLPVPVPNKAEDRLEVDL